MGAVASCLLLALLAGGGACAYITARLALAQLGKAGAGGGRRSGRRLLAQAQERMAGFLPLQRVALQHRGSQRDKMMRACMPEALRLIGMALNAGNSLVQALRFAAENCAEPLASELQHAVWDLEAGKGFDEAMDALRTRAGGSEFAYLAVAMEIQHRSGGSLNEVLESVAGSLRQKSQLDEELRTKTTQGRLSARIVALMPLVLLGVLSLFSGDYLGQFFSSAFGVALFAFALLLECLGVVLVRRTLAIDLSSDMGGRG